MRTAIDEAAQHDRRAISEFPEAIAGHLPGLKRATRERDMEALLATLGQKRESHVGLFDEKTHLQLLAQGQRRLSFKATMAVVFVQSFGLEPRLQMPLALVRCPCLTGRGGRGGGRRGGGSVQRRETEGERETREREERAGEGEGEGEKERETRSFRGTECFQWLPILMMIGQQIVPQTLSSGAQVSGQAKPKP